MSHPHERRTPLWKRRTAIAARWLHIYLSMVSFAILFFFAVTGITLNHAEWFKTISGGGQSMENGKSAGRRLEAEDGAAAGSWARTNRRSAILCGPVKVAVLPSKRPLGILPSEQFEDEQKL